MKNVKVCILRTGGTNCDRETGFAFSSVGAEVKFIHVNRLVAGDSALSDFHILALPGGFSYGDDIAAGKILANELRFKLNGDLRKFVSEGKPIIGICNGFQILVKSGLLPGNEDLRQEASLIINDSGKFEDRWVYLKSYQHKGRPNKCIWTKGLPDRIYLPVAHGEGKFLVKDKELLARLKVSGQVVFQYCDEGGKLAGYPHNPNGSEDNIAGICDVTGRIFGLMPHPERHIFGLQHPRWPARREDKKGDGLAIFRNGVEYARKNL